MRCFLSKSQDAMDMGADVRHAAHSAVPSGLRQSQISVPNVETLGYYRPSLRDDEWQILVALGFQTCGAALFLLEWRAARRLVSLRYATVREHGGSAACRGRRRRTLCCAVQSN